MHLQINIFFLIAILYKIFRAKKNVRLARSASKFEVARWVSTLYTTWRFQHNMQIVNLLATSKYMQLLYTNMYQMFIKTSNIRSVWLAIFSLCQAALGASSSIINRNMVVPSTKL